jgi:hypothetical protein
VLASAQLKRQTQVRLVPLVSFGILTGPVLAPSKLAQMLPQLARHAKQTKSGIPQTVLANVQPQQARLESRAKQMKSGTPLIVPASAQHRLAMRESPAFQMSHGTWQLVHANVLKRPRHPAQVRRPGTQMAPARACVLPHQRLPVKLPSPGISMDPALAREASQVQQLMLLRSQSLEC